MQVPTEQGAGWAPEEASIIWRMGKYLVFKAQTCNPPHSQCIDCTIPAPSHTLSILTQDTLTVAFGYAAMVTQATTAQNGTTGGLPWLRWRVTGLSLQWLRVSHRSSAKWCEVEQVSLTEKFLPVLWLSHQHHFTNAPYSFIHLLLMLYHLSNWQTHQLQSMQHNAVYAPSCHITYSQHNITLRMHHHITSLTVSTT